MKRFPWVIPLFAAFFCSAQKEHSNWYFGNNAGISFRSGQGVVQYDNPNRIYKSNASISDPASGELLFYTDGQNVWNRTHSLMANGGGMGQAVGDVFILPWPEHKGYYFIFMATAASQQLSFATVNMNTGGGLVETIDPLYAPVAGQLTAVRHAFADAWWLIGHNRFGSGFLAFYVDKNGVAPAPIQSLTGQDIGTYGDLTASRSGRRLAITHFNPAGNADVELLDFDRVCGTVSNPVSLPNPGGYENAYGVAFSDDDSKLYVSYGYMESQLVQYSGADYNTATLIATSPDNLNNMRLGPDGRIYINTHDGGVPGPRIDVIRNPRGTGAACNYVKTALNLGAGRVANFELPNFVIQKPFQSAIRDSVFRITGNACVNTPLTFRLDPSIVFDSLSWNFGDSSAVVKNQPSVTHTYAYSRYHHVLLTIHRCGRTFVLADSILTVEPPRVHLGSDTAVCEGTTVALVGPHIATSYLWSTGDSTYMLSPSAPGTFWLRAGLENCYAADTITIAHHPPVWLAMGDEYFICDRDRETVKLDAGEGFTNYLWKPTGDTSQWIIVEDVGPHFVVVKDFRGCDGSDGTQVKRKCPAHLFFPNAFTPNSDGVNDSYAPEGSDILTYSISIYNAWGELVFTSNNFRERWDGSYQGKPAQAGVYFYAAEYAGFFNKRYTPFSTKGTLTLLR